MKKFSIVKSIFILTTALNTTACALYSKDFDSKYEKGVGCKSISEVNQMVDDGSLKGSEEKSYWTSSDPKSERLAKPIILTDQGNLQRVQEEHLRVWIAPFQDEQGNFHEASIVHTVIKPGFWQLFEKS